LTLLKVAERDAATTLSAPPRIDPHQLNIRILLNNRNSGNPSAKVKGRAITYCMSTGTISGGNLKLPTSGIKTLGTGGAIKNAAVTAAF
jgi:hypothetical protein